MSSWLAVIVLLIVFLIIALAGTAFLKVWSDRSRAAQHPSGRGAWWFSFLLPLMRPVAVLVLSGLWLELVQRMPLTETIREIWWQGTKAWLVLWGILLVLALFEGVTVSLYSLRGKTFPVPPLLRNIVRGFIVLAVVFSLLKYSLGVNISPLLASTALVTAVVGFALQGVLGNLMAGMSLHLVRSVVPGDWVRIDDVEGQVVEMNWRETRLRTNGGHYIILPNSRVANAQIHNMAYPDRRRRHEMLIPLRCTVPPEEAAHELAEAAAAVPGVLKDPPPTARIAGFKDYAVEYRLRFWSESYYNRVPLEGDVARMVWYRLRRRGIELPLPVAGEWVAQLRDAWSRSEQTEREEIARRVDDLKKSELVSKWLVDRQGDPLIGHADLERLAEHVRRVRYATGEAIFRQGDVGTTCYVVVKGRLRGSMEFSDAPEPAVFDIMPGALIGEMSLVTHLPRVATVLALEETELLEISEIAFQYLLALRPDVPERLAAVVAERAAANAATLGRLKSVAAESVPKNITRKTILDKLLDLIGRAH